MVDPSTSSLKPASLLANDTVLEPLSLTPAQERRRRIVRLREAIQRDEYRVSACELADAILRAAHRAN